MLGSRLSGSKALAGVDRETAKLAVAGGGPLSALALAGTGTVLAALNGEAIRVGGVSKEGDGRVTVVATVVDVVKLIGGVRVGKVEVVVLVHGVLVVLGSSKQGSVVVVLNADAAVLVVTGDRARLKACIDRLGGLNGSVWFGTLADEAITKAAIMGVAAIIPLRIGMITNIVTVVEADVVLVLYVVGFAILPVGVGETGAVRPLPDTFLGSVVQANPDVEGVTFMDTLRDEAGDESILFRGVNTGEVTTEAEAEVPSVTPVETAGTNSEVLERGIAVVRLDDAVGLVSAHVAIADAGRSRCSAAIIPQAVVVATVEATMVFTSAANVVGLAASPGSVSGSGAVSPHPGAFGTVVVGVSVANPGVTVLGDDAPDVRVLLCAANTGKVAVKGHAVGLGSSPLDAVGGSEVLEVSHRMEPTVSQ